MTLLFKTILWMIMIDIMTELYLSSKIQEIFRMSHKEMKYNFHPQAFSQLIRLRIVG